MSGTDMTAHGTAVCIIVENETVPFDRRVWMEACALRDAGYSVSVISPKRGKYRESRQTIEGIEIYRYWCWNAQGILGHVFEYSWSLVAQFLLAIRIYARTRFRVLHACNPPETVFLIGMFFKLFGVRFVFDHHDLSPELYLAKYGKETEGSVFYRLTCAAERMTFRTADFSIATNQSYRDIAISRGKMSPDRVVIVRTCARREETSRALKYAEPSGRDGAGGPRPPLVVYVGTIGPQDGVDLLLQSVGYILREKGRGDIRFLVVGSGTELPRLKTTASQMAFNGNVEFLGRVDHDQVDVHISVSDVCVSPDPVNSFNDNCSMIKIFEYMAHGKPIVLYDLKEGRRSAGDSALYARANDPKDFAEQILKLLDSAPLREKLGQIGRQRVDETFNWEAQSKKLIDAYEKVLNG